MYHLAIGQRTGARRKHPLLVETGEGEDAFDAASARFALRGRTFNHDEITITDLPKFAPPDPPGTPEITGTALEIADDLLRVMADLGSPWWKATTAPAPFGGWYSKGYDSSRIVFWSHELEIGHVARTFKAHDLRPREIVGPGETDPPGWMEWELLVVREFPVEVREAGEDDYLRSPREFVSELARTDTPEDADPELAEMREEFRMEADVLHAEAVVLRALDGKGLAADRAAKSKQRRETIARNRRAEETLKAHAITRSV